MSGASGAMPSSHFITKANGRGDRVVVYGHREFGCIVIDKVTVTVSERPLDTKEVTYELVPGSNPPRYIRI